MEIKAVITRDQFSFLGNRARYDFIELDMSTGLDELIDLGKPSSICRYRARIVEDGEARTLTFPGGQVECYRAR